MNSTCIQEGVQRVVQTSESLFVGFFWVFLAKYWIRVFLKTLSKLSSNDDSYSADLFATGDLYSARVVEVLTQCIRDLL